MIIPSETALRAFLEMEARERLKNLKSDTVRKWGMMTPQHMVEHLVSSWRIGNGKFKAPCMYTGEKLEQKRQELFSEKEFEPNTKNPILPENDLLPLRKKSLEEAIQQLELEVRDFFVYFAQNPGAEPVHPMFGALDMNGWMIFQYKHMQHHFRQFGV